MECMNNKGEFVKAHFVVEQKNTEFEKAHYMECADEFRVLRYCDTIEMANAEMREWAKGNNHFIRIREVA